VTDEITRREQVQQFIDRGALVKICGLREPEHAFAAAAAGADLVGFIFAPARRQVTASAARSCIEAAREAAAGRTLLAVGVFIDAPLSEIEDIAAMAGLDAVQLHGAEPPDLIQHLPVPAIKALRPRPEATAGSVISEINRYVSAATPPVGILVDGYTEHALGGTGARADWAVAAEISAHSPMLLAGGLEPENVRAAIRRVRPQGVDVSSGVEIGGVKDPALITQFIRSARSAFGEELHQGHGSRVPSPTR